MTANSRRSVLGHLVAGGVALRPMAASLAHETAVPNHKDAYLPATDPQ